VIDPTAPGTFGGTESRAWTIAQGLAQLPGCEVTFVVRNKALHGEKVVNKVRILPKYDFMYWTWFDVVNAISKKAHFPYFEIKHWNWKLPFQVLALLLTKPFRMMGRDPRKPISFYQHLPADIVCAFGVHSTSCQIIASQLPLGRRTVLFLGADSDLDVRYTAESNWRSPYNERGDWCYFALKHADVIVAQTEKQQTLLMERFGRTCEVMRNPLSIVEWQQNAELHQAAWQKKLAEKLPVLEHGTYVLWVGRLEKFHKRADLLMKIARACPEIPFVMLAGLKDETMENEFLHSGPPNLIVLPPIPFSMMPAAFEQAAIFLTSSSDDYEGFPNTVLQAGASKKPVLSLEVAAEYLQKYEAGQVMQGNLTATITALKKLWEDADARHKYGMNGFQAVHDHYSMDAISTLLLHEVFPENGR
jgi:glycosyltransferase involved in cell wall biosynthesis